MKAFSNSNKLKSFIAPKITYLTTFLDNKGKSAVYTGGKKWTLLLSRDDKGYNNIDHFRSALS